MNKIMTFLARTEAISDNKHYDLPGATLLHTRELACFLCDVLRLQPLDLPRCCPDHGCRGARIFTATGLSL
jgi:hypothetical protein